ncbi:MAG TPA: VOC family protein [Kiloniellales bacterium]|jgi:extradiol dioxygenase family protein|nr:VOC family protein [Kiloniellales bacterium]
MSTASSTSAVTPFHLAFPVSDLEETRRFYLEVLGCGLGREAEKWIDFNFFGNQISAHLRPDEVAAARTNEVDGDQVPVRHFGAVLEWDAWHELAERLKEAEIFFIIEPHIRFKGQVGEQATMFFTDPSGNALEFKSFKDQSQLFAR